MKKTLLLLLLITGCTQQVNDLSFNDSFNLAKNRVMSDYNYETLNGSNLRSINNGVVINDSVTRFSFHYDVTNASLGVNLIEVSVSVDQSGRVFNFSYTELGVFNDFQDCVNAGYEALYPDCIGCKPYCELPSGERFNKTL